MGTPDGNDLFGVNHDVSRRRFLAWVGGGAAALAVYSATGCTPAKRTARNRAREIRDLHFALAGSEPPAGSYLLVGTRHHALHPHTDESRRALTRSDRALRDADVASFTHYASGVSLPADRPLQIAVMAPDASGAGTKVLATKVNVPSSATHDVRRMVSRSGFERKVTAGDHRLELLGVDRSRTLDAASWVAIDQTATDADTAAALVFKHPLVLSLNSNGAAITLGLIYGLTTLPALTEQITVLRTTKGGYRTDVPVAIGGKPVLFPPPGFKPAPPINGQPPIVVPTPKQPDTAELDPSLTPLIGACVKEAVQKINNSTTVLSANNLSPAAVVAPLPTGATPAKPGARSDAVIYPGLSGQCVDAMEHGVVVALTDDQPDVPAGQPLAARVRVRNDYARFLGVYAQYFDTGGVQVPPESKSFVDTKYASSVALTMPVLTIAGVPVPDSSTREFTITLPHGASSARLLSVGLGNARFDTPDWSTYFLDADGNQAYASLVNPPEAMLAILFTAVLNFGFPAAMLALDSIAADGYRRAVNAIEEAEGTEDSDVHVLSAWAEEAEELLESIEKLETPTSVLGRFINMVLGLLDWTTEQAAEGDDDPGFLSSAWGLVKAMGIAFSEFIGLSFLQIVVQLLVEAAGAKSIEAIPFVGEAFAVTAALIDAANLAEGAYATASSPWVMATELGFTYPMTVTIDHDPKAGMLPPQAKTFRVTVQIAPRAGRNAGSAAGRVLTVEGDVADYAVNETLVVTFPQVPFGGRLSVQVAMWSGSVPGQGWQAAGGTSPWYDNDDSANLPSPEFPLVQNLVPINAKSRLLLFNTTAFESDPTVYDAFQFTPTPQPNTWTAAKLAAQSSPYMQAVGNITFSSPSNAVAYTYLGRYTSDSWFVRSYALLPPPSPDITKVPSVRWAGPYARRPWVLYDPLETDPANGQHFILEPVDPAGYRVRRVPLVGSLVNRTGDPFPDPDGYWGRFLVDLDDVAIYHQGFLVGVNTALGTLAILRIPTGPAAQSQAQIAKGFAGLALSAQAPPGLLAQPTNVAVTLEGTVLVLESARNRLQAFNLAGQPVGRFPATAAFPKGSPYAPLVTSNRQYLGLSVDGGGAIYVLSVPSVGGRATSDYRLDVYGADGKLVYTSVGINVADIAVDYFRNVHGVDFAPLTSIELGVPAILHLGDFITLEPSVSSWYTSAPGSAAPPAPSTSTTSTTSTTPSTTPAITLAPPSSTTTPVTTPALPLR